MKKTKRGAAIFLPMVFFLILSAVLFVQPVSAVTLSTSQIFISSEKIKTEKVISASVYISPEANEPSRKITFSVPDEFSENIIITPNPVKVSREEKIEIILKNTENMKAGENNIEIKLLEDRKELKGSLNNRLFIKVIIPEIEKTPEEIKKKKELGEQIFAAIAISIVLLIVFSTVFTITHLLKRKREKINDILSDPKKCDDKDIKELMKEIERVTKKIKEKENKF
jgi:hypothetical protein